MFYEFDLTIPANTSAGSPVEIEAVMASGIIKHVSVQIPRGARSLVHTVARRGLYQVWPSNPDGSHKGDDPRIAFDEDYDFTQPPYKLTLRGWSPDTSYSHVVTWRFQITPAPARKAKKPAKKKGILSASVTKGAG